MAEAKVEAKKEGLVEYTVESGSILRITPKDVRNYLVNGNAPVTDGEVMMFLALCKENKLNPFTREAYLIKYGSNPANMVIAKDVYMKRAKRNPNFKGFKAGICVLDKDGNYVEREGTIVLPEEKLIGGWAEVYLANLNVPNKVTASLVENSKGQSTWKTMPALMIRKVALVQALREVLPEELGGLYDVDELNIDKDKLPTENVIIEEVIKNGKEENNTTSEEQCTDTANEIVSE